MVNEERKKLNKWRKKTIHIIHFPTPLHEKLKMKQMMKGEKSDNNNLHDTWTNLVGCLDGSLDGCCVGCFDG